MNEDGKVEGDVYRKATHTSKYLDFHSHSPGQGKRAVGKTLLDRAKCILSRDHELLPTSQAVYQPINHRNLWFVAFQNTRMETCGLLLK